MRRVSFLFLASLLWLSPALAQGPAPESAAATPATSTSTTVDPNTAAAAAVASGRAKAPEASDFLEHLVDSVLHAFNVQSSGNTTTHFVIATLFVVVFYLLRLVANLPMKVLCLLVNPLQDEGCFVLFKAAEHCKTLKYLAVPLNKFGSKTTKQFLKTFLRNRKLVLSYQKSRENSAVVLRIAMDKIVDASVAMIRAPHSPTQNFFRRDGDGAIWYGVVEFLL